LFDLWDKNINPIFMGVTNEEGTAYPSKASVLVGFVLFISSNEMLPVFSSVLWYVTDHNDTTQQLLYIL
jgi:hypothetical protein